ncbi:MAG: EAL domain-containing protein [Aquisalimonadaceae bacterium]
MTKKGIQDGEIMRRLRERAVECSRNGMAVVDMGDPEQPLVYVNPAFCLITGYSAEEALGRNCRFLQGGFSDQPGVAVIRRAIEEGCEAETVLRNYRKDGSQFWNELHILPMPDEHGRITHFVGILHDITIRRHYEEELAFRIGHDGLTGLPNRMLLMDRLKQAVAVARRKKSRLAVLHIDLDGFKVFNDSQGHLLGDELLRSVADRLQRAARSMDTVARFAGDEFVMLCTELNCDGDVRIIAERVMAAVSQPIHINQITSHMTCSIGISMYPSDSQDPEDLIRNAGLAMSRAKDRGRNGFASFTTDLSDSITRRLMLGNDLRQALNNNQFHLVYQPQFSLGCKGAVGLEALLRWEHPMLGPVSPAEFIPVAEETGLIIAIGEWVLLTACMQQRQWVAQGLPAYRIAVNISARQFARQDLQHLVRTVLEETGLPPSMLELELTESVLMENAESFVRTLRDLRTLGVTLAIDDFGTGYSSLSYLKRFPIDRLKIDRSFVNDVTTDRDDAAIVRAMIAMAHSLRLGVVAEGVETADQFNFLRELGCDGYQGFLFSHPLSIDDVPKMDQHTDLRLAHQPGGAEPDLVPGV